jgi:photosystem II stability/assembly factor-like uncharacterized protein
LSAVAVVAAGVAFLRPQEALPSPPINSAETTTKHVLYVFPKPRVGWALASQGDGARGPYTVFRTTEAGARWNVRLKFQAGGVLLFQFFDNDRGFVETMSPAKIYRTTDGGSSWQTLSLPESGNWAAAFADSANGLIASADRGKALYVTHDGGDSWQKLADVPTGAGGLYARKSEAWMGSRGSDLPRVYTSADFGTTWQPHDIQLPLGYSTAVTWVTRLALLPGKGVVAYVLCECPPQANNVSFQSVSLDGGTTWRNLSPPLRFPVYQNDLQWWSIENRKLYRTMDAGLSWSVARDGLPAWEFLLHGVDPHNAWATLKVNGGFGLAQTEDGGNTWRRALVPQMD